MAYNDDGSRTVKNFVHMLAALAFVPISDAENSFATLKQRTPANMRDYVNHFDTTYVNGKSVRGKLRALPPRYAPHLWNRYDATKDDQVKTNKVLEGWHNRFRFLVSKAHPDLYVFI